MSVCWYLVRETDHRVFDLGKCNPPDAWPLATGFTLPPHPELVDQIADDFACMGYTPDMVSEVANRMIVFAQGGIVTLRNDASYDFDDELIVGSS